MKVFRLCEKTLVLHLEGCSVAEGLHRKAVHTILLQVQAAAGPRCIHTIHHALVEEGII